MITKQKLKSKITKGLMSASQMTIKDASKMMTDVIFEYIEIEGCLTKRELDKMATEEYNRLNLRNEWEPSHTSSHQDNIPPLYEI